MSQTVYKLIEAAGENVVIEKILKVNSNKAYTAEELKEAFAEVIKNTAPKNVNVDDVNARMRNIILEIDRRILNGDIPINKDLQTQTYIYIYIYTKFIRPCRVTFKWTTQVSIGMFYLRLLEAELLI